MKYLRGVWEEGAIRPRLGDTFKKGQRHGTIHPMGEREVIRIMVIHGPNLNRLGTREPEIYGSITLDELNERMRLMSESLQIELDIRQTNHEGEIIDWLHEAGDSFDSVVINPGGYTHTSVSIRDAVAAIQIPVIEVHLTDLTERDEEWRKDTVIGPVCDGVFMGMGPNSYLMGIGTADAIARARKKQKGSEE